MFSNQIDPPSKPTRRPDPVEFKQGIILPKLVNLGSQVAQENPSVDNGVRASKRYPLSASTGALISASHSHQLKNERSKGGRNGRT